METVSREDGGFTVDVVQSYLDSGQCSDAHAFSSEGEHEREKKWRTIIGVVDRRINLVIRPLAE